MSLATTFQEFVESLPADWTDLELDLRIADETHYVEAAVFLVVANAQPYSQHDWHWRLLVAHRFGHARKHTRAFQDVHSTDRRHSFPERNIVRVDQTQIGKTEICNSTCRRSDVQRIAGGYQNDCQFASDATSMA